MISKAMTARCSTSCVRPPPKASDGRTRSGCRRASTRRGNARAIAAPTRPSTRSSMPTAAPATTGSPGADEFPQLERDGAAEARRAAIWNATVTAFAERNPLPADATGPRDAAGRTDRIRHQYPQLRSLRSRRTHLRLWRPCRRPERPLGNAPREHRRSPADTDRQHRPPRPRQRRSARRSHGGRDEPARRQARSDAPRAGDRRRRAQSRPCRHLAGGRAPSAPTRWPTNDQAFMLYLAVHAARRRRRPTAARPMSSAPACRRSCAAATRAIPPAANTRHRWSRDPRASTDDDYANAAVSAFNYALSRPDVDVDTLRRTFRGLSFDQAELANQRYNDEHPGGPSLYARLGIHGQGSYWGSIMRGGPREGLLSGDEALEIERGSLGTPTNDRERFALAALTARQQIRESGWLGRLLASEEYGDLKEDYANLLRVGGVERERFRPAPAAALPRSAHRPAVRVGRFDEHGGFVRPSRARPRSSRRRWTSPSSRPRATRWRPTASRPAITTALVVIAAVVTTVLTARRRRLDLDPGAGHRGRRPGRHGADRLDQGWALQPRRDGARSRHDDHHRRHRRARRRSRHRAARRHAGAAGGGRQPASQRGRR